MKGTSARAIEDAYRLAQERYSGFDIDTGKVLETLDGIPISIQCWQGDDVLGFENPDGTLSGGIQTSGNYPGRARNATELRADLERAFSLIPGTKRLNLHAIYLESDIPVERDKIEPKHFAGWVAWARKLGIGLDFNPTCFSHPNSAQGLTLEPSRCADPEVLDRPLHRVPQDQRIFRRAAGQARGDEYLDPRRL